MKKLAPMLLTLAAVSCGETVHAGLHEGDVIQFAEELIPADRALPADQAMSGDQKWQVVSYPRQDNPGLIELECVGAPGRHVIEALPLKEYTVLSCPHG